MNIGNYVRTESGIIARQISEKYSYKDDTKIDYDNDILDDWYNEETIIKSSPNIIDLIEEGDYVNGWRVILEDNNELYCGINEHWKDKLKDIDIKSIVTKEQFERMKYKV